MSQYFKTITWSETFIQEYPKLRIFKFITATRLYTALDIYNGMMNMQASIACGFVVPCNNNDNKHMKTV